MKSLSCALFFCLFIAGCSSSDDVTPAGPSDPEKITLKMNRSEIFLKYLQRDTLLVEGMDMSQVTWHVAEGDSCVTMLGNVVVARRKGTAKIMAKAGEEWGKVDVNVTSEEYIPVKEIVYEINGHRFCTSDTAYWQGGTMLEVKCIGCEPSNATHTVIKRFYIDYTQSNGRLTHENSSYNSEDVLWYMQSRLGIETDSLIFTGPVAEISPFSFRLAPEVRHSNDSIPSCAFMVYLENWPADLPRTLWDNRQIASHLNEEESSSTGKGIHKRLYFTDIDNRVKIIEENDAKGNTNGIYIREGESKQLHANVFAPEEIKDYIYWVTGTFGKYSTSISDAFTNINNIKNNGKLHISESGLLSLEDGISAGDIGMTEEELKAADTLYIGVVSALLLPDDSKEFKDMELGPNPYVVNELTGKSDKVKIYWLRE